MIHANDQIAAIDRRIAFVLEEETELTATDLFSRVCDQVMDTDTFIPREELRNEDDIKDWVDLIADRFRDVVARLILKRAIAAGQMIDHGDGTVSFVDPEEPRE